MSAQLVDNAKNRQTDAILEFTTCFNLPWQTKQAHYLWLWDNFTTNSKNLICLSCFEHSIVDVAIRWKIRVDRTESKETCNSNEENPARQSTNSRPNIYAGAFLTWKTWISFVCDIIGTGIRATCGYSPLPNNQYPFVSKYYQGYK